MSGQELGKPFPQPGTNEVDIERRFNVLVTGVQTRVDLVARRFPEVSPPGRLKDIFRLATKEEMVEFSYADHDARYHPSFPREILAEQIRSFISQHRAISNGKDAVLVARETLSVDSDSSLMKRFMHETGHIMGGGWKFHQEPPHKLVFPWQEFVEEEFRDKIFPALSMSPDTPVYCGRKGFLIFAHTDGQKLLGNMPITTFLEEVRACIYQAFITAFSETAYKSLTPERYLQDLLTAYKETEDRFDFHAALIDYILMYGLDNIIRPVAEGNLAVFMKGANNRFRGRERHYKKLLELGRLYTELDQEDRCA